MAEGGQTPDLPRPEDIARANAATERAASRIPKKGLTEMNINSYVASLTDMADSPVNTPEQQNSLNRTIGLYSYMRDNFHAETVGGVRSSLEQRQVDPKIVKLWVDEGMAVNPGEYDAIGKGYPEYKDDLKRVRNEVVDRILHKGK